MSFLYVQEIRVGSMRGQRAIIDVAKT